jgi:hypothetical protein
MWEWQQVNQYANYIFEHVCFSMKINLFGNCHQVRYWM